MQDDQRIPDVTPKQKKRIASKAVPYKIMKDYKAEQKRREGDKDV